MGCWGPWVDICETCQNKNSPKKIRASSHLELTSRKNPKKQHPPVNPRAFQAFNGGSSGADPGGVSVLTLRETPGAPIDLGCLQEGAP